MMRILRVAVPGVFCLFTFAAAQAQPNSYPYKVAQDRMLWHDKVDKEQQRLFLLGGSKDDSVMRLTRDEAVNLQITDALGRRVDELQQQIEFDSTLNTNGKKRYLRGLTDVLSGFDKAIVGKSIQPSLAPELIGDFVQAMELDKKGQSIEPVINASPYEIGIILVECFSYAPSENIGIKPSRLLLTRRYCEMHPSLIFNYLSNHPGLPFEDSLIIVAGHYNIERLYDFAAAGNELAWHIRNSKDSLIHTVAMLAGSKSGRLYIPFLDNLVKGKLTTDDIDKVKDDNLSYYRLLVKTRLDYAARVLPPLCDTPLEMNALTAMLEKKGKEVFVSEINGLHTVDNPAIRFKILDPLTPEELYYLIVLSEDEIYTSSYLGVYDRIFQRMKAPYGDSLLMDVHGDYFRKFIKMAAAYNKLEHFLGTMDKQNAGTIMKSFVIHLEKKRPWMSPTPTPASWKKVPHWPASSLTKYDGIMTRTWPPATKKGSSSTISCKPFSNRPTLPKRSISRRSWASRLSTRSTAIPSPTTAAA
jgi:hypothetical protein